MGTFASNSEVEQYSLGQVTIEESIMKISLIGYGRMGHAIDQVAQQRGHEIVARLDAGDAIEIPPCDVVIDFSTPDSAYDNVLAALRQHYPVVSGTTGWMDRMEEIKDAVRELDGTFFYSSNYSVGVFVFRHLVRETARIMDSLPQYSSIHIDEVHHIHKQDYPSGTALTVAQDVIGEMNRFETTKAYLGETEAPDVDDKTLLIHSLREGEVPGIHRATFGSTQDVIRLEHEAYGREGFAVGAVMAGEFLQGKKGIFGMADMLHF